MTALGLEGKVALVTGVNNPFGIGAAIAHSLAAAGAAVFSTYLACPAPAATGPGFGEEFYRGQNAKSADEVLQAVRAAGGRIESLECDLADPASILALFDQAERIFGRVDILVNNAAHCVADTFIPASQLSPDSRASDDFPVVPITPSSIDRHFAVNSRAVALTMAEFARRHVAADSRWGRIINISTDGASGFNRSVSYGASKHAMESFSQAAAGELGIYGITVNVLSLGAVQTGWISPEVETRIVSEMPIKRVGQPKDVGEVVRFFASDEASWITGQLLYVGGGHMMPL
jgi:3-oxoacyl-[acyl-carrier protein] reductase